MNIGFIGLGIMGSRMAANLLKAGYSLVVHNRSTEKAKPLLDLGAVWADTPALAAENADILITILADPEAVLEISEGHDGFLDQLAPNSLWIDCSTVNPSFSQQMAKKSIEKGLRFLDAPVAGTKKPAKKGELLFLIGGEAADIEEAQPLFDIMGRGMMHVGGHGMGSSLKMVFNLLLGQAMIAFSEGIKLGQSLGISQETLLDLLVGGRLTAPYLAAKKPKIESGNYEADFPLRWLQKDLRLAVLSASENDLALPLTEAAREIYAQAIQQGLGDEDFSAIHNYTGARD